MGSFQGNRLAAVLFFLSIAVNTACSGTQSFTRDRGTAEPALVMAHGVRILSVNGLSYNSSSSGALVSPGENEFIVAPESANFQMLGEARTSMLIIVKVEAGKTYSITGARGDRRLCAFPVDEAAGGLDYSKPAGCYSFGK